MAKLRDGVVEGSVIVNFRPAHSLYSLFYVPRIVAPESQAPALAPAVIQYSLNSMRQNLSGL